MEGTILDPMRTIPHLTLVPGGLRDAGRVSGVCVSIKQENDSALRGLTVVHEEDTHLVLSAPSIIHEIEHHPVRVLDAVWNDAPQLVGSIVERPGALLAVVHDLGLDPSTRPEWIRAATRSALVIAERRRLRRLVFQPLGALHGRMTTARAIDSILEAIAVRDFTTVESIIIRVDSARVQAGEAALGRWLANHRANR